MQIHFLTLTFCSSSSSSSSSSIFALLFLLLSNFYDLQFYSCCLIPVPPTLSFVADSPRVSGTSVEADFIIGRPGQVPAPGERLRCQLIFRRRRTVDDRDCSSLMMYSFDGLNPNIGNNFYSLSITLYSVDGDVQSNVIRNFTAGELDYECRVIQSLSMYSWNLCQTSKQRLQAKMMLVQYKEEENISVFIVQSVDYYF